jgi:hypothetical protein
VFANVKAAQYQVTGEGVLEVCSRALQVRPIKAVDSQLGLLPATQLCDAAVGIKVLDANTALCPYINPWF